MPKALTYEELREFDAADLAKMNKIIVELIRVKRREMDLTAGAVFKPGDYAKFTSSKTGELVHIQVQTINPKSLIGKVLLPDGTTGGSAYRVSPSLCTKTTLADAIDAMKPKIVVPKPAASMTMIDDDDDLKDDDTAAEATPAAPVHVSDPSRDVPVGAEEAW